MRNPNARQQVIALALTVIVCGLLYWLLESLRLPPVPIEPTPTATVPPAPTGTPTAPFLTPTATDTQEYRITPTATVTATPTATLTPTITPTIVPYRTVVMLRHDAMESVFYWFPERRDLRADAFIAMYDCRNLGRWFWLRLPDGFQYRVVVTDCMQEKHRAAHRARWGDVEVIELDGAFWRDRGLTLSGGVMAEIAETEGP